MSALVFANFGGVAPRVPPRMLGDALAQVNRNLLPSAQEFRPLLGDRDVGAAEAGAKTLYRMERRADGTLHTGDAEGWMTFADERSYCKGQLNDDATERTILTFDDGRRVPRAIDASGADRPLGVPAPAKIAVTLHEVPQFTPADAEAWIADELVPRVYEIVNRARRAVYWSDGKPIVGFTGTFAQIAAQGTNGVVRMSVADASARGLYNVVGYSDGGLWAVPLQCAPKWERVDIDALERGLRDIESPRDGSQIFTDDKLSGVSAKIVALFAPEQSGIATARKRMTDAAQEFLDALDNAAAAAAAAAATQRPQEPQRPTTKEYKTEWNSWNDIGTTTNTRPPEWIQYDANMSAFRRDLDEWEKQHAALDEQKNASVAAIRKAQAAAANAFGEITSYYNRLVGELQRRVEAVILNAASSADGQLFETDPERIEELRYYVATYVTDWGWESAPSPLSEALELDQNDRVTVTVPVPPDGYGITHWRLYRSNSGTQEAVFQFVEECLITTPTYEDEVPSDGLGETCPTWGWAMPPYREDKESAAEVKPPRGVDPYLRGAVSMPNGIVAGFVDNFVAFCDPYHPYAWPVEYQITTEHPIVGLGVFGQTLFVGTMGYPYFISGADSASMSAQKLAVDQPCVSRRSIVAMEQGVVYASPDGLCFASASGVQVATAGLFAREDWQALTPASIIAAAHEGVYYFWTADRAFALDVAQGKLAEIDVMAAALHRDVLTDGLFAVVDGRITRMFADGRRKGHWHSRIVQGGRQEPFAWMQVDGEHNAAAPAVVRWYGDGKLRHEVLVTDCDPHRLPAGRWREHEIELQSAARITALRLASTTAELQQV